MNVQVQARQDAQKPPEGDGMGTRRNRAWVGGRDADVDGASRPDLRWQTATLAELLQIMDELENRPRCVEADADGGEPLRKDSTRV